MVIYKVKIKIAKEVEQEWFKWMSTIHIPDVINTGHFVDYTFMKLLQNGVLDPENTIFEINYFCKNQSELDAYKFNDAEGLRQEHTAKYGSYVKEVVRSEYADLTELEPADSILC